MKSISRFKRRISLFTSILVLCLSMGMGQPASADYFPGFGPIDDYHNKVCTDGQVIIGYWIYGEPIVALIETCAYYDYKGELLGYSVRRVG